MVAGSVARLQILDRLHGLRQVLHEPPLHDLPVPAVFELEFKMIFAMHVDVEEVDLKIVEHGKRKKTCSAVSAPAC